MDQDEPIPETERVSEIDATTDAPRNWCRVWWAALAIILIGAAVFSAKPAYRALEKKNRRALLVRASEAESPGERVRLLQMAFQADPADAETLRALADHYMQIDAPRALPYLKTLRSQGAATPKELETLIGVALGSGATQLAREVFGTLKPAESFERAETGVRISLAENRWDEALWRARQAAASFSGTPDEAAAKLLLAGMLRDYPVSGIERRESYGIELVALLQSLAAGDDEIAAEALAMYCQIEIASVPGWPQMKHPDTVATRLFYHPVASLDQRLFATALKCKTNGREDLLARGWRMRLADGYNAVGRPVIFASWLLREGFSDEILTTYPWPVAASSEDLAFIHLLALVSTERWEELDSLLEGTPPPPLPPSLVNAFAATAAIVKDPGAAHSRWFELARAIGSMDAKTSERVATLAERADEPMVVVEAYKSLAKAPNRFREAWDRMLAYAMAKKQTHALEAFLSELAKRHPESPSIESALEYCNLLLGTKVTEAAASARERLSQFEVDAGAGSRLLSGETASGVERRNRVVINALLAAMLQGDREAANRILRGFQVVTGTPPGHLAIYAAALYAAGYKESARTLLSNIDPEKLLPEERAYYDDASR